MQDESITRHYFENKIGAQIVVKTIGKDERDRIIKMYDNRKKHQSDK